MTNIVNLKEKLLAMAEANERITTRVYEYLEEDIAHEDMKYINRIRDEVSAVADSFNYGHESDFLEEIYDDLYFVVIKYDGYLIDNQPVPFLLASDVETIQDYFSTLLKYIDSDADIKKSIIAECKRIDGEREKKAAA